MVKKQRYLLTAVIGLILIAALAAGCTFTESNPSEPMATEPSTTEPAVTEPPVTVPTVTEPPVTEAPPESEPTVAEELIKQYQMYQTERICCDFEYVYQDMSEFLTDAQKEERYFDFQYRITCCHSADEVRAHIDRTLGPSLVTRGYPDDRLFMDDQSNLYLMVIPTGSAGYSYIQERNYTDTHTLAYACYGYDTYKHSVAFLIEHTDDGAIIKQTYQFIDPPYAYDPDDPGQPAELTEEDTDKLYAILKAADENAD